jgi:prepilin-type N-terminal cleavage/methylation domain-containing protein
LDSSEASASDGFTLLELLVTLGVVSILLAILLPTLARSRERAHVLAVQVNQRECANIILQ